MVTDAPHADFALRLNEALDDLDVPPKGRGRQVAVAKMFGVSQKGARKWLEGEARPRSARIEQMCRDLGVLPNWLLSGDGDKSLSDDPGIAEPHAPYLAQIQHLLGPQNPHIAQLLRALGRGLGNGTLNDDDARLLLELLERIGVSAEEK